MTTISARRSGLRRPPPASGFNRKLIAPMILGSVLNPINSSILAVSLVPIGVAFGAPASQTAWLVSALYLATAVGQPVVGRLIDTYGPRRLYLAGTALVGAAGLLGAFAPDLGVLIAARMLLGFGTCAGYPAAMYLIGSEGRRTGRDSSGGVLTALAIAGQTSVVIGPSLGGMLIGLGGWRATFAVNIPLALAGFVLGASRLPRTPGAAPSRGERRRLDLAGIIAFVTMLTSLLLFLMHPGIDHGYLLVIAAVMAVGLTVWELRVGRPRKPGTGSTGAEPFLDLRLFARNPALAVTYGRTLLAYTVSYAFFYGYPQWLEAGRGLHAAQAGLVLLPLSLLAIVVASATGRRPQVRGKLLVGAAAQITACALLLLLHPGSATWQLVAVAVVMGVPQGLNNLANQNALYHQADPARIASAAGLLRTFTYLGAMAASAASGAFLEPAVDTRGLHHLAVFMLAVAVLFFVVTLVDRSLARIGHLPARSGSAGDTAVESGSAGDIAVEPGSAAGRAATEAEKPLRRAQADIEIRNDS